ncbi:MAG: hypothetical protein KatS3mg129_3237 [Leptospiraceae bacterium]|nr:MAG: hypothetical protein KatS3mg129_3237 [Leptospiraceae bacterium]
MKKSLLFSLIFLKPLTLLAISGISSTKLIIPTANILSKGITEIDINFYILNSKNQFNEKGKLIPYELDCSISCKKNRISEGGFAFRATGGIGNQMEIGVEGGHSSQKNQIQDFIYSYIDDIKFGFKWNFYNWDQLKISYQQGLTYDYETFTPQYESGFLFTREWQNLSIDLDIHYFTTKRINIYEEQVLEQSSWYSGPHASIGIGYSINNFLFAIEYSYEEAKTKVKQYQYFSYSEFNELQNKGFSYYYSIENQSFHQLSGLPEFINNNGILIPIPKIFKKMDYYTISRMIYYGFAYNISNNMSLSFIIHKTVGGANISNSNIFNIVATFIIL